MSKVSVLFVCLGNICRSPMAEAVFRHKVAAAGLADLIEIDSVGTGSWHVGAPPHRGTRALLDSRKISYEGMRARQIDLQDLTRFDYILAMDGENLRDVAGLGKARGVVKTFLEYAPQCGRADVPDPYMDGKFEEVHELVDAASEGLLAALRRDHPLLQRVR